MGSRRDWILIGLAAGTLSLYLPAAGWGIPHATGPDRIHAWGNDDLVPLAPLAEMSNVFVEVGPHRNVAYPLFHYLLLAAADAPYLGALALTGSLTQATGRYPFGLRDPVSAFESLSWIGHGVTLLLALATVLGAYLTGRELWGRRAGLLGAVCAALMFPMVYYANTGNLDVPVLGWTSLALACAARSLKRGLSVRLAVSLGALIALAGATKDQSGGSFFLLLPALLVVHLKNPGAEGRLRPLLAGAASGIGVYVLASGIPLDPERFWAHLTLLTHVSVQSPLYLRHPGSVGGTLAQCTDLVFQLIDVMSLPVLAAAGAGVILALRGDRRSALLLLSSLGFLAILVPVGFSRIHYLLPVALPLCPFAGLALSRGLRAPGRWQAAGLMLALGVPGYASLRSFDLVYAMTHDSHWPAAAWLAGHLRSGDHVAYFGAPMKNPALPAHVETLGIDRRNLGLPLLREERPEIVIVMPEDTDEERNRVEWRHGRFSVASRYVSDAVWIGLRDGSLGYRLVARFQAPRLLPWIYRPHLSYASVNPPIQIFVRKNLAADLPALSAWTTAPYNPPTWRINEPTPRS